MRIGLALVTLALIGCAEARAKRLLAERDKPRADRSGEPDGEYTCETMTLTGSHVPKTYCFYDDEDAANLKRIKQQTNLITSEALCPPDAPGCPRLTNGP